MKFICNILITGKIECVTGLHIGGGKEGFQIGNYTPVVRDPVSSLPYIPGSSLKGKMRMLLEFAEGLVSLNDESKAPPHNCSDSSCPVCRILGSSAEDRSCGPTRLIIRDAYPDKETIEMWSQIDSELLYTELKYENAIDRITSAANPRPLERITKGSTFDFEMVYGCYDMEDGNNDIDFLENIYKALNLLEHSALGGNSSRGYGQVCFTLAEPVVFTRDEYQKGIPALEPAGVLKKLSDISFSSIKENINRKLGRN